MKRIVREYTVHTGQFPRRLHFLIVGDLHNSSWQDIVPHTAGMDALLVPGDIANRYTGHYQQGLAFLKACAGLLPVFMSPGNHDTSIVPYEAYRKQLLSTGIHLLDNCFEAFQGVAIGGANPELKVRYPDRRVKRKLEAFYRSPLPKLLLCHRPEKAEVFTAGKNVALTISAHAHGGQIRLLGRGIYAPGQGLFPKLTKGLERPDLLVTTGAGNPCGMPRWGNPRELVKLTLD